MKPFLRKIPLIQRRGKTRFVIKPDGTEIPALDANYPFLVVPNEEDIKNGIRGDHTLCMYCLFCKRTYGSELVWVTRGVAWVELPGKGGRHELRRHILTLPARAKVGEFDAGKELTPHAVIFAAPTPARRLDAQKSSHRKWLEGNKSGEPAKPSKKAYVKGTKPKSRLSLLRDSATGMFQFRQK